MEIVRFAGRGMKQRCRLPGQKTKHTKSKDNPEDFIWNRLIFRAFRSKVEKRQYRRFTGYANNILAIGGMSGYEYCLNDFYPEKMERLGW